MVSSIRWPPPEALVRRTNDVDVIALLGVRCALVVPVRDHSGALVGLQFIGASGEKRFLTGSPRAGAYDAGG
jgi:phage/plasmid primase-like uncharacterized protein